MRAGFPQYSNTAKLGEFGVRIVSKVISDTFGWLFKRNHQEHDFGIDGQVELVTNDGAVTGQMLAVQIKCGRSFLVEKNKWGFVYMGERKHLNYLLNYPLPVIICLCDPDCLRCYWVHFRQELTERTRSGWTITVPFDNILDNSKEALNALVIPVRDCLGELEAYWKENEAISNSSIIIYALDETDVKAQEVGKPRAFFDRMRCTKGLVPTIVGA